MYGIILPFNILFLTPFIKVKVEYEKIENEVAPGVFGVRLKIGTEVYTGTGTSYKLAKQVQ